MIKCPKCELNYMENDAACCEVCRKMLHGTDLDNELDLCPECGEPFATGKELCNACLKSLKAERAEVDLIDEDADDDIIEEEDLSKLGLSLVDQETENEYYYQK